MWLKNFINFFVCNEIKYKKIQTEIDIDLESELDLIDGVSMIIPLHYKYEKV